MNNLSYKKRMCGHNLMSESALLREKYKVKYFPESNPVSIRDRNIFLSAYRNSNPATSDMVFNSIFGWQEFFDYRVSRLEDLLLVFYFSGNSMMVLPPFLLSGSISDPGWAERFNSLSAIVSGYCRDNNLQLVFSGFPEIYLKNISENIFNITRDADAFDYIYKKSDLVDLPGGKFASKRNLIRQFERNYQFRYEPLTKKNISCLYRFIRRWKPKPGSNCVDIASGEYRMVYRLMKNYDLLDLQGGILFSGNKEIAVTVGTIVTDFRYDNGTFPTVIVHTEHALIEYKGCYQKINQLFCADLPEDVMYINREEDLGISGLRKAKMSYYPEKLLNKAKIIVK